MIMRNHFSIIGTSPWVILVFLIFLVIGPVAADNKNYTKSGKNIYEYYCYQCHGYDGSANTTAAQSVHPKPANFRTYSRETTPKIRMINAVQRGISNTAMVSFRSVLSNLEIESVVEYIRSEFMSGSKPSIKYHSAQNGWNSFDNSTYKAVLEAGKLSLTQSDSAPFPSQGSKLQRYRSTCIACHELKESKQEKANWRLFSVSFPVGNYEEEGDWPESPATAYDIHEHAVKPVQPNHSSIIGAELFQSNCAHCHAEDGSGQSWIGAFLEPQPVDIKRSPLLLPGKEDQLTSVIINGIPGSSMPAWKNILDSSQISQLQAYLQSIAMYDPIRNQIHSNGFPGEKAIDVSKEPLIKTGQIELR